MIKQQTVYCIKIDDLLPSSSTVKGQNIMKVAACAAVTWTSGHKLLKSLLPKFEHMCLKIHIAQEYETTTQRCTCDHTEL